MLQQPSRLKASSSKPEPNRGRRGLPERRARRRPPELGRQGWAQPHPRPRRSRSAASEAPQGQGKGRWPRGRGLAACRRAPVPARLAVADARWDPFLPPLLSGYLRRSSLPLDEIGAMRAAARKWLALFLLWWADNRCFLLGFGPDLQHLATIQVIPLYVYIYVFVFVSKILGIPWHTGEYPWRRP